ncbi:MAG TPA: NAD(P)-dependent oxidoreductase [Bacteroidota bacterium]|nr:NAD(P)-dependent oxidoreductase [Bacteroidota bacterium]
MDVYFYETFEEEAEALKNYLGSDLSYEMTPKTIQETNHTLPPAALISIRTQSIIPPVWANRLDGVLSRSTGFDHLKTYLTKIQKPLPCGYLEEYATRAVAEHAILLMMALLRKLPQQLVQFNHFERDGVTGFECAEKNLLVVGVGRIGSEIAKIGMGLGMNVRGVDLVQRHAFVHYVSREEGIRWADIIISAMNLTPENAGYFSESFLRQTKRGAILINIARGEHTPTAVLQKLIQDHHLGGIGLDVYEDEPSIATALRSGAPNSLPAQKVTALLQYPNVLFTPHNAFNSYEAVQRKSKFSAEAIRYFLQHHDFQQRVLS